MSKIVELPNHEEPNVKELLDGVRDVLLNICDIEKGQTFNVKITDHTGTREEVCTDLERAKGLAEVVLHSYLMPLYELLGYE